MENASTVENPLTTKVYEWEEILVIISCIFSILGSSLIIITYFCWKTLRTSSRLLLVYLSVVDLSTSAAYLYGIIANFQSNSPGCIAQSIISTFSATSSFFWTLSIALYLYFIIVKSDPEKAEKQVKFYHLVSWGIPLVTVVTAAALQRLGYDSSDTSVGWCWVKLDEPVDRWKDILWMILCGKLWELLAYFTLPVLYILMKRHIYIQSKRVKTHDMLRIDQRAIAAMVKVEKKLIFIPLIFILLHLWSTIRFFLVIFECNAVHYPLLVALHGIGNSFQGGANFILFCLCTTAVREKMIPSVCHKCCDHQTPASSEENHREYLVDEQTPLINE